MADETTEEGGTAQRSNGYDPEVVRSFADRIENVEDDIDKIMGDAKDECAPLREDIIAIKKEAHDAGIPREAFNAALRERRLLRQADGVRDTLEGTVQESFDQIKLALGMLDDTPLGAAVLERANGSLQGASPASA